MLPYDLYIGKFFTELNKILLIFCYDIIYIICIWTDSQNNFFLFQRIQSISRWRTTQLDFQNRQQGSAAVDIIHSGGLSEKSELIQTHRTYERIKF